MPSYDKQWLMMMILNWKVEKKIKVWVSHLNLHNKAQQICTEGFY